MDTSEPVRNLDWRINALLARLPDDEYARVVPVLRQLEFDIREPVHEHDKPIEQVYFPLDAVFSVVEPVDNQYPVEVTTVGNDGVVGLPVFLGASSSTQSTFCQVRGSALRMKTSDLFDVLAGDGTLHRMFRLYAQATIAQLSRNVVCNRMHSATQRASRWLLMTHDRVNQESFQLTQEFLAQMLGVRRATVSEVASELAEDGLIRKRRGAIEIADRQGLEAAACECYTVIRKQSTEILDA